MTWLDKCLSGVRLKVGHTTVVVALLSPVMGLTDLVSFCWGIISREPSLASFQQTVDETRLFCFIDSGIQSHQVVLIKQLAFRLANLDGIELGDILHGAEPKQLTLLLHQTRQNFEYFTQKCFPVL